MGTLAAALSSFAVAVAFDGNGFIAAFVAGIAFGAGLDDEVVDVQEDDELPELLGEVLALAVWFSFGAALVPVALHHFDMAMLFYALLSLTVVRLVPVALSLLGSGLDGRTVLFVGWSASAVATPASSNDRTTRARPHGHGGRVSPAGAELGSHHRRPTRSPGSTLWQGERQDQTARLTGKVAIQTSAPTRTAQPTSVITQRRRWSRSLVLMPAKNSTTA
jgi:hypothetical protein